MSSLAASNNSSLCIAGNFNMDLLDIKNEAHVSDFVDVLYSHNLFPTIYKPARITNTSASVLDNVFLNNLFFQFSGLLYADISDHLPIFTAFDCSPVQSSTSKISQPRLAQDFSNGNIEKFSPFLQHSWDFVTESFNVEHDYQTFVAVFSFFLPYASAFWKICKTLDN